MAFEIPPNSSRLSDLKTIVEPGPDVLIGAVDRLTEILPVINVAVTRIDGVSDSFTLRLSHDDNRGRHDVFLAMSRAEVEELGRQCRRAIDERSIEEAHRSQSDLMHSSHALNDISPFTGDPVSPAETVLETFNGYVDQIDGDSAFVRLRSRERGDVLHGKYSAVELASKGIGEQGRFVCETIKVGEFTRLNLKALPDAELSDEELRAADERLHRVIPRDDPGIEY